MPPESISQTQPRQVSKTPRPHFRLAAPVRRHAADDPLTLHCPVLDRGAAAIAKRAIDLLVSASLLALLALPMLLIALLIKRSSPGPALYAQRRVGLGGRSFMLLKFRTMRIDAEAATGPIWATQHDPRRTWLGGLLRRWSLDELPQLVNVLRGDMSLVGPRPERPFFVTRFSHELPNYMQRHGVPPGLTGWAQLNGLRGNTSISMRLQYDLHYIANWSIPFDLLILLLTPFKMLTDKNAY